MTDSSQVHRAKEVLNLISNSSFTYVFISMYTPEFSPVEKIFAILKDRCKSFRLRESINLGQQVGYRTISNEMTKISSSQIVAIWRNFVHIIYSRLILIIRALST